MVVVSSPRRSASTYDREKLKHAIHYVTWKAGQQSGFGITKLGKALWFADARAYALTGKPITGATYVREEYGPAPQQLLSLAKELEDEGLLRMSELRGESQFHSLRRPDLSLLSASERQEIDSWIEHVDEDHAANSRERSRDCPWEIAGIGEVIPFHAQFAARIRKPEGKELEWANSVAERLKLP